MIHFEAGVPVQAFPPDRGAMMIAAMYLGLAALLVAGMLATRHGGRML